MSTNNIVSRQQKIFFAFIVIVAATILLFETGIMPKGGLSIQSSVRYFVEVAGVFITIGLIPLSVKRFNSAIAAASHSDDESFVKIYRRECEIRMMLLFVVIMANIGIYYATDNNSALYCALTGGLAYLFSFPKNKSREEVNEL